jgi:hypothetical protein
MPGDSRAQSWVLPSISVNRNLTVSRGRAAAGAKAACVAIAIAGIADSPLAHQIASAPPIAGQSMAEARSSYRTFGPIVLSRGACTIEQRSFA